MGWLMGLKKLFIVNSLSVWLLFYRVSMYIILYLLIYIWRQAKTKNIILHCNTKMWNDNLIKKNNWIPLILNKIKKIYIHIS